LQISLPRLTELDSLQNDLHLHNAQVAVNDVARTLTGKKRTDHVRISDLLGSAGLPGINQVAVQAMATMTWAAFHSHDGPMDQTTTEMASAGPFSALVTTNTPPASALTTI
jgi:hypothetical protein